MSILDGQVAKRRQPPSAVDTEQRTLLAEYPVPETVRVLPPAVFDAEPAGAELTTQTDLAFYLAPE